YRVGSPSGLPARGRAVTQTAEAPPPVDTFPMPRIEAEDLPAARLEAEQIVLPLPSRGTGTITLALSGLTVLLLGLAGREAGNFVADQFARSVVLGWLTLLVSCVGFGLIGACLWRELRGLM